jgi:hypothetical protein
MNAADLMLAPGNIFKADIRERPCEQHKREYRRSTANHPGCQQWQGKANVVSYIDIEPFPSLDLATAGVS